MRDRIETAHEVGGGAEEAVDCEEDQRADQAGHQILAKVVRLRNNPGDG